MITSQAVLSRGTGSLASLEFKGCIISAPASQACCCVQAVVAVTEPHCMLLAAHAACSASPLCGAGEVGLVEEAPLALRGGDLNDDDITADASAAARITACAMYCDSAGWLVHHLPFSPVKGNGAIFVAVCRVNGAIELFALPDMARVWAADDVVELPSVLLARDDVSSAVAGARWLCCAPLACLDFMLVPIILCVCVHACVCVGMRVCLPVRACPYTCTLTEGGDRERR